MVALGLAVAAKVGCAIGSERMIIEKMILGIVFIAAIVTLGVGNWHSWLWF